MGRWKKCLFSSFFYKKNTARCQYAPHYIIRFYIILQLYIRKHFLRHHITHARYTTVWHHTPQGIIRFYITLRFYIWSPNPHHCLGSRSNHRNDEKKRIKNWKRILWHYVCLTWNSVDLSRKYTRQTQEHLFNLPTSLKHFLGSYEDLNWWKWAPRTLD